MDDVAEQHRDRTRGQFPHPPIIAPLPGIRCFASDFDVGRRSRQIAGEQFPEIVWQHSHVVVDGDMLESFCIYEASDEEMIRRHAELPGCHVVDHVYEIGGDVTPDDFPL